MSALGQKQTYAPQNVMSALPPKADMCGAARDVCFGPKADSCSAAKNDHHYSMISSAVPSSDCGIVRPSAFAVWRLTSGASGQKRTCAVHWRCPLWANSGRGLRGEKHATGVKEVALSLRWQSCGWASERSPAPVSLPARTALRAKC
jgi:hypothetical protein